jgi:hypothetical protein
MECEVEPCVGQTASRPWPKPLCASMPSAARVAVCGVPSVPTAGCVARRMGEGNASFGWVAMDRKCPGQHVLRRAVRPLAAGAPVAAWPHIPAFEWAARPTAVGALFVVVEGRYALHFGEQEKPRPEQQNGEGSVLNTRGQIGCVEQAPNPSFERTANGVRRSGASGQAVPPLAAAQVKR